MALKENTNRREDVTYALYVNTVNDLKLRGKPTSLREVKKIIGGSHSTLLEYQRQWQADRALAATVEDDISDTFKQAILAEFGRVVQTTREKLEAQLIQERQHVKEANELLAEAEKQITDLEMQQQSEREQASEKILTLEKQLAAADERANELQKQVDKLEAKITQLQQQAHQSEIKAAVAEARVSELEKQKIKPKELV